jgi:hypothetical protein
MIPAEERTVLTEWSCRARGRENLPGGILAPPWPPPQFPPAKFARAGGWERNASVPPRSNANGSGYMLLMAEKHQVGWSPSDKDVILDRLGSSLTRCALLSQFVPLLLEDETSRTSGLFLYLFFSYLVTLHNSQI